jgi:putative ABC transport system permease protein
MQFQPGADPIDQVRQADPDGNWAMTAATWLPDGGQSVVGTVLAVDSSRLARVAYPAPGGPALSQVANTIGASTVPVVKLTSGQIRASITATALSGPAPDVQFTVRTLQKPFINVSAGRLRSGTHDYIATLDCPSGCTLLGITWNRPITTMDPMRGQTLLTAVAHSTDTGWTPLDLGLTRTGSWRAGPESGGATDTVTSTPAGVRDDYASRDGGYGAISYAYSPSPIPAMATPAALSKTLPNPPQMIDGLNIEASFAIKRTVSVLPAVLDQGIVLDLTFLRAQLPAFDSEANWQVWLGPHAPADALTRLRAAGLVLGSSQTEHARVIALGRQGPALSLFLLLACAIVGSVLAVGGTAISISASARRRSFEMAALRTIGVRSPTLYRAGLLEQLLLLGTAVALGLPAGILAARLAMPVIPEFADTTPIALSYAPAPGPIVLFAAAFIVIVGLSAAVASYAVLRGARPARLREAEE